MRERDFTRPGRSVAIAASAMAATSHPAATLAALDILRAGGNAVDAAIAAVALQGVVEPHNTGIGGDCFALYAPAGGAMVAFNGSGTAPAAIDADAFAAGTIGDTAAASVTIPGAVDAWCALAQAHGRLGIDRLLAPAIKAAEDGYVVTPRVARDWAQNAHRLGPEAAGAYLPGGRAPRAGDTLRHPPLARTLRAIAAHGRAAFYEGEVAADMVDTLRALGGVHTADDFAGYRGHAADPIATPYRDTLLHECPPNGQGLAALLITRILDGFDLAEGSVSEAERIHLLAEATKIAYRQRDALLADPAAMTVAPADLLDPAFVDRLRALIRPDRALDPATVDVPRHPDTVLVGVVDRDGNAISLINSLFFAFGSGILAPASGVLLQNRGAGFSTTPGHPNVIAPGKRPLHTIIPAILSRGGRTAMCFGMTGGQYQAAGHAHIVSAVVDRGLDPQAASDLPRHFHTEGAITLEATIPDATRMDLEARGHRTRRADGPLGGCQAIVVDHERGVLLGGTDHREDGIALGY